MISRLCVLSRPGPASTAKSFRFAPRKSTALGAFYGLLRSRRFSRRAILLASISCISIISAVPGLNGGARSKLERFSQATRLTQSLDHRAPAADRGEPPPRPSRKVITRSGACATSARYTLRAMSSRSALLRLASGVSGSVILRPTARLSEAEAFWRYSRLRCSFVPAFFKRVRHTVWRSLRAQKKCFSSKGRSYQFYPRG